MEEESLSIRSAAEAAFRFIRRFGQQTGSPYTGEALSRSPDPSVNDTEVFISAIFQTDSIRRTNK